MRRNAISQLRTLPQWRRGLVEASNPETHPLKLVSLLPHEPLAAASNPNIDYRLAVAWLTKNVDINPRLAGHVLTGLVRNPFLQFDSTFVSNYGPDLAWSAAQLLDSGAYEGFRQEHGAADPLWMDLQVKSLPVVQSDWDLPTLARVALDKLDYWDRASTSHGFNVRITVEPDVFEWLRQYAG